MKLYLYLLAAFAIAQGTWAARYNITCYYDTFSIERGGYANFTQLDLKTSLEYCTHIVFGYVALKPKTFEIQTLHSRQHQQFSEITKLKTQYRHIKFLLSLGGGKDLKNTDKYMELLNDNEQGHQRLISSARRFLLKYKFDGLDLAYQFPETKYTEHSAAKNFIKQATDFLKSSLSGKKSKNIDAGFQNILQKQRFNILTQKFKSAFRSDKLMLTLTVLPNVNASYYLDIPAVTKEFDFINLASFDYSNPQRSPHEADFLAPLVTPHSSDIHLRRPSVDSAVGHWLSHRIQANKLNIGIPTFGRAWKLIKQLKSNVMPITSSLNGPALGGELTHTPGILSWTEVCTRLDNMSKTKDKKYGNFAYRSANIKGHEGILITYEDEESLAEKAEFVRKKSLGGVAIFDLTLDDFRGKCKGGKFPALKAIKFKLH